MTPSFAMRNRCSGSPSSSTIAVPSLSAPWKSSFRCSTFWSPAKSISRPVPFVMVWKFCSYSPCIADGTSAGTSIFVATVISSPPCRRRASPHLDVIRGAPSRRTCFSLVVSPSRNRCRRAGLREVRLRVLQQVAEVLRHDVRLVVRRVLRVQRVLALEHVYGRQPVPQHRLAPHQDPRLVVDEHVVLRLELLLHERQVLLLVREDQHPPVDRLGHAAPVDLCWLEHGVAVGDDHWHPHLLQVQHRLDRPAVYAAPEIPLGQRVGGLV